MRLNLAILRRLAVGVAAGLTGVFLACCTGPDPGSEKPWVELVPNTEHISGAPGSMLVSPDGEWMTFVAMDHAGYPASLTSVALGGDTVIQHDFGGVVAEDLAKLGDNPYLTLDSRTGLRAGWYNEALYFHIRMHRNDALIVDNSKKSISGGRMPRATLMVVDGPEWNAWRRELKSRSIPTPKGNLNYMRAKKYSAVWSGQRYGATTYAYDREAHAIIAYEDGGRAVKLADLPGGGPFKKVSVRSVRVSPNEKYLAYVLEYSSSMFPSPIQNDVIIVVDLASGKEKAICSFRLIGDWYWSAKGDWIYLMGKNSSRSRSAYIIDVGRAMS